VEKAASNATIEVFGNAEYAGASWGGLFGESGSGFGGNIGVRVFPSPNTRCGFGFRYSRFGFNGTESAGLFSDDVPIDGSVWTAFADLYVHSQTQRAQVFFFVGAGFGAAAYTAHYQHYGRVEPHDHSSSFFGADIGVGLKVPVTKRLAIGPEFRAILAPRHDEWVSMSIGVGMTYTVQK
jgi:opacity protein-like surface antigen